MGFSAPSRPATDNALPDASLPAPDVQVIKDSNEWGVRSLRLRLASTRHAPMLLFYFEPGSKIIRASLDGQPLLGGPAGAEGEARGGLRVSFAAPPPEGVELLLEMRLDAPALLTVEDLSYGLPELPGQSFRPRADDAMPAPSYRTSDTTVVRRTLDLSPPPGR